MKQEVPLYSYPVKIRKIEIPMLTVVTMQYQEVEEMYELLEKLLSSREEKVVQFSSVRN